MVGGGLVSTQRSNAKMKRTILMLQGLALTGCSAGAPFVTRRQSIRLRRSNIGSSSMTVVGGESSGDTDDTDEAGGSSCAAAALLQIRGGGTISNDSGGSIRRLAKRYGVDLPTNELDELPSKFASAVLTSSTTSLAEAMQRSNADARFLVVYISRQGSSKANGVAIPNLMSREMIKLANRRPLGKKQNSDTSSYYIWIVDDDGDYDSALKRLKLKPPAKRKSKSSSSKSVTPPILAIVYPSTSVSSSGKLTVTPNVLSQHHCQPPPGSPDVLTSWINATRKRHLRDFAKLQHDRREAVLHRERTEGYRASVEEDAVREAQERAEAERRRQAEEEEERRREELEARREVLRESLPEEPEPGAAGASTIALRFADGTRDQRRFPSDAPIDSIFDWIDVEHEIERERLELGTMNGSRTFVHGAGEASTIEGAGLGRMTALRVGIVEGSSEDAGEDDETEGDESEEYSD